MRETVSTAYRLEQIRARRRITMRVGLAAIIVMTALTACIFDQGDYQGGGRKDNGGSSQTVSASTSAPTDMPTATDMPGDDAGDDNTVFIDAGGDADAG